MRKRILGFTGIRSDYDLLSLLYKALSEDSDLEFKLLVSGAHLSPSYGLTVKNIHQDQIPILAEIETLIDSDSRSARLKSASLLLQNCIHDVTRYNPDLIIFAGDREDVIIASLIGAYLSIPTVHFYGGDHAPDGHVDNTIRHATSKLASAHFVAHRTHGERLKKMGESPERIFWVGSPALDKFRLEKAMGRADIMQSMNVDWENYAIVIFHPMFGDESRSGLHFKNILDCLAAKGVNAFVSYPNIDAGSKEIIEVIAKFSDHKNFVFYKNLSRNLFVNLLRNSQFLIGNSSLGIYEAPLIPIPVINVGQRQRGRYEPDNVIFVDDEPSSISAAIEQLGTAEYRERLGKTISPFGDGYSVKKCLELLKSVNFKGLVLKTEDPLRAN